MENTARQPALFLGHGSPMTVITDNAERRALEELGRRLPRPDAVLLVTAHWETHGETRLTAGAYPRTIHDFRGFPQELYEISYAAPGALALAHRAASLIGEGAVLDEEMGLDHGVWGVLRPMFPEADIPVVAMSVDMSLPPEGHLALGAALAPLRDENVLIAGSGNIIHNLALWRQSAGTVPAWADSFRNRMNAALRGGDETSLTQFAAEDEEARAAINSGEHYLPLLYPLGARGEEDDVAIFNDSIDGSLSMTSVLWGDARLAERLQ
ncbi:4,5-DOPA dioxygenase extradiol [Tsuneonella sp. CC-YZS046]|uniref:4,5-DOPA-extradiol-dioxygenase n=1 Tax=Tsuneonella sp. CC-YZS046 TaxID=3042152 RepID=UPI002D76AEBA|nr:4,5-DOPA dioxygenase extradiol [Tsuneonella sp. CC-YZS046]WRO67695.1 4,5-DOPA dioxygenase extradiol [Tsuneonella sp. CC-YZS046]